MGAGALGPVFRAFDPEHDRLVAVKRFQLDVPPERVRELVAQFDQLIAAQLTHPVIAAPVATGLDGTVAYLATEYVSGDSLDIVVREYGPAPAAGALRVAAQLAGALDFAAVVNIHHGALHARDVLLASDETRLTGIGVAAALEHIGVAVPVRRPYAAPERVAGGDWDRRADIFSLAALLHELLWAKRIAGTGSAAADAITEIEGGDVPALRDVFARGLAENPAHRFGTALEFAEALSAAFPNLARTARASRLPAAPAVTAPSGSQALRRRAAPPPLVAPIAATAPGSPDQVDLPLRERTERYRDLGEAAAIAPPIEPPIERPIEPPRRVAPAALEETPQPEFMASALEQSRSAIWPLVLAMMVGVALGFAGGYSAGSHDRAPGGPSAAAPAVPAAPLPGPPAPAVVPGHESTEVAVNDPPQTPPSAPAPAPSRPAPAPSAAPKTETSAPKDAIAAVGSLLVRSTPAGARVFVDGHEYGKTPIAVRELLRGPHRVRVVHDGFSTEERRVVLSQSRPAQSMIVPLTRTRATATLGSTPTTALTGAASTTSPTASAPAAGAGSSAALSATAGRFTGALTVESRPSAAKVYLDGALMGTTPLQLPDISAGEHAVRLEHDGYRLWTSSVRVVAAETNRVTASLEK